MIYELAFYVPAGSIAVVWVISILRKRAEWNQPLFLLALFFTVAAALAAVWAMAHTPQLRARSYIDYRYEIAAVTASLMGFCFGLIWSRRPGQGLCWIATLSSVWLAFLWFVVITSG